MNLRIVPLLLLFVLHLPGAKTPPRQWQMGKFKEAEGGQYDVSASPNGGALTWAVTLFKNHSYVRYAIESEKYVFIVELSGSAHVIVNGEVKFATEKETIWFLDADGTERKTKILKQILKEPNK